ncbi:MAG: 16S rRNA (guanine(527)-N(7))-methyltransferase RsmG [Chromatiales bacterium]|nr:16S rRNA (guanine(527)-N(7))-methyltransferase RsmG [Chromatiales bacterium]
MNTTADGMPAIAAELAQGLAALGIPPAPLAARLLAYLALLAKWNRVHNLTAVRDMRDMVRLHLLDSLAVAPFVADMPGDVADVGSGPGLPGIPLALHLPERHFTLIETSGKKASFLRQAVIELGLVNVEVVQLRAENYRPPSPFATVISRAFAALADFVAVAGHLCAADGRLLAMKGRWPGDESEALPAPWQITRVHRLDVPGVVGERHLIEIRRASS